VILLSTYSKGSLSGSRSFSRPWSETRTKSYLGLRSWLWPGIMLKSMSRSSSSSRSCSMSRSWLGAMSESILKSKSLSL